MRRARITFQGAFHHAMNRGIDGKEIFKESHYKSHFLDILAKKKERLKIRIFAYCLMDNHYHLVIENSSGRMSDFFKQLNGEYAFFFRLQTGGKGYVFQERFKSTLIQDDSYLKQAIAYVLMNPVRAKLCDHANGYQWSSIGAYFIKAHHDKIVDSEFVNGLFGSRESLNHLMELSEELPVLKTRYGHILGEAGYLKVALKKFNRRKDSQSLERKRNDDRYFEPVEKVIQEFEKKYKVRIEAINVLDYQGKRLRGELLLRLKDLAGLTYSEIGKLDIFSDVQVHSLGRLYQYAKARRGKRS